MGWKLHLNRSVIYKKNYSKRYILLLRGPNQTFLKKIDFYKPTGSSSMNCTRKKDEETTQDIIIELLKTSDKGKILNVAKEKGAMLPTQKTKMSCQTSCWEK